MRVLLAEDSTPLRGIIRQMLNGLGHDDIVEAGDGLEAWKELEKAPFDLLLTDWNMPNMSGLQLLQKVRQADEFKALPVVMLTTRNNKADIISAMKAGVNNYVTKPCSPADLNQKIEKAVLQQARKQPKASPGAERIIRGSRKYRPGQRGPFVLIYETPGDMEAFASGQEPELQRYFDCIYGEVERANQSFPGLDLGYDIEQETKDATRLVTDPGQLVHLVMISARQGTGLSLVRRLRYGQEKAPPTCVVCDSFMGLDPEQRRAITDMGAEIIERKEIDPERFRQLLKSHLVPQVESGQQGLKYLEIVRGSGAAPQSGQMVTVEVQGMLRDGAIFEDSRKRGQPLQFVIGHGKVAPGLELGVGTMRRGGRTLFVLPPDLGFPAGDQDRGIGPAEKLIYSVELLDIGDAPRKDPLVE